MVLIVIRAQMLIIMDSFSYYALGQRSQIGLVRLNWEEFSTNMLEGWFTTLHKCCEPKSPSNVVVKWGCQWSQTTSTQSKACQIWWAKVKLVVWFPITPFLPSKDG